MHLIVRREKRLIRLLRLRKIQLFIIFRQRADAIRQKLKFATYLCD